MKRNKTQENVAAVTKFTVFVEDDTFVIRDRRYRYLAESRPYSTAAAAKRGARKFAAEAGMTYDA